MRKYRLVPSEALFEVTCRTFQNRPLLAPTPETRDLILGVVGRAQRLYGIKIHALVFLSTHYHLLITARDALQMARFEGYLNSNVAREIGRFLGWRDKFWGRRYEAIPVSEEAAAQVSRLHYLLAHGVKEGLVASPADWPGVHSVHALLGDGRLQGTWRDRTREFEARRAKRPAGEADFSQQETVVLTPLPCWQHLDDHARKERVRDLLVSIVEAGRIRGRERGRLRLEGDGSKLAEATSRPRRTSRSPAPRVHAASTEVRLRFLKAYKEFVVAFRAAAEALRAGDRHVEFPPGSFPPALPWVPLEGPG